MTEKLSASSSTTFPTGPGGYTCSICKAYVPFGGYHQCPGYNPAMQQTFYTILPADLTAILNQIEELKASLKEIKELLADNK